MKTVAQYAFTGATTGKNQARTLFEQSCHIVDEWIKGKGATATGTCKFKLSDGAGAELEVSRIQCTSGGSCRWMLTEFRSDSLFSTTIVLATADTETVFTCSLSSGSTGKAIAPRSFTARCPGVVGQILKLQPGWCVGTNAVPTTPLPAFVGKASVQPLVSQILSPARTLPIIVASRYDGFLLHPTLVKLLAADICGLGIVADMDDEAAWEMTRQLGKEWSCFNGAIRIYWPNLDTSQPSQNHPLWTSERQMYMVDGDTELAARRIRNVIRKRLFSVSTFALEQPPLLDRLEDESTREAFQEKLKLATSAEDYQKLAEEFDQDNATLRLQLRQERDNIKQLRQDLYTLQLVKAYADADEEVTPDEDTPPETVEDAVDKARRLYAQQLTFGDDVAEGILSLALNAGPPDKILDYLAALASMVEPRRDGSLGTTVIQWLANKGVNASNESQTTLNDRDEMKKRKWHDGRGPREFEMHLKPAEAAHPDRCVRIYFDWDEASAKVVIGWVGRHP